ncbi:alpha/beta hydrolase-fold protein [Leekyejoonella antrihumi]|uniref:Uncharacterized protein n=1 Tax=Leekyejoonella antrihumi TaxID=1660198 RepID=A0A563DTW7_9MICO|nr:alpha/beta hydrolase-fold protein [Leekyejoonella antrihumi]TWP33697.1 hypothetical protein FGL98_20445 [Leekyejoonella antrihumi]
MTELSPFAATLPTTDYFELDSELVGDRLAIWVTKPVNYTDSRGPYPVLYTTDGNASAALLAPYVEQLAYDVIESWVPFVHVAVGYPPEGATSWLTRRTRELVPPGELPSESVLANVHDDAEAAGWTAEEEQAYRESIMNGGRADNFLAFLEQELRPVVEQRYNVRTDAAGLFGYSGSSYVWWGR